MFLTIFFFSCFFSPWVFFMPFFMFISKYFLWVSKSKTICKHFKVYILTHSRKRDGLLFLQLSNAKLENGGKCLFCSKAHPETCQTSKIEFLGEIVNGIQPLTISTKSSILDIWKSSEYDSAVNSHHQIVNSLSANPTKWSKTLKQFVGKLPTNCLSVWPFCKVGT